MKSRALWETKVHAHTPSPPRFGQSSSGSGSGKKGERGERGEKGGRRKAKDNTDEVSDEDSDEDSDEGTDLDQAPAYNAFDLNTYF